MKKIKVYTNRLYLKIICLYVMVLLFVGGYACRLSYTNCQNEILNDLDDIMTEMNQEYEFYTQDFWRLYMPIFQNKDSTKAIYDFFRKENGAVLSPLEKKELLNMMQEIAYIDGRIKWIGLYSGGNGLNYLYFEGESALVEMPPDFPFIEDMENKGITMEIYGSKTVTHGEDSLLTFALCGGTEYEMNGGKIIVGYATNEMGVKYAKVEALREVRYYVVNEWGVVYDSTGEYEYPYEIGLLKEEVSSGVVKDRDGNFVYVRKLGKTGGSYQIFCVVPWKDLFAKNNVETWQILATILVFLICSLLLYLWTCKNIIHKIDKIEVGLKKIGDNELDYRIPIDDKQMDEFENISKSINKVAVRLKDNINKTYELKLKQKEAVLSELQTKFDPHFLYNTLEVIRGRVYENGDIETSDVIIKLAQIFRSFIGSEMFVTIREEIDFCNMYLSLLKYRYEDKITIVYDIESDILQYGIMRNLLQPVLENFFVHGFDSASEHNTLKIRGKIYDEKYIWFYIQDDGLGISEERLAELKVGLDDAVGSTQSSYGLKNVHRRIKLFYGQDCGVKIENNASGGVTVEVKISKLTYKEHEIRMYETS